MKHSRSFWEFFIEHKRFTIVIMSALILLGLFSMVTLPKESNPEVNVPFAIVSTVLPGASAEDVEELVTDVIEDKIVNLEGVKQITSTSGESLSVISVEFSAGTDTDERVADLKEQVDEVTPSLPEEAEDPFVQKVRFSDQPIYTFSMSGPFGAQELKRFAENLQGEIERVPGVSKVEITGAQEEEIQVIVDKGRLDSFGLGIAQVTGAIARANADVPTGSIESGNLNYTLRLAGRLRDEEDVKRIPIGAVAGTPIFVQDVARVSLALRERESLARLSVGGKESQPALSLSVFKTTGGNIIQVVDGANEKIEKAKENFLPENIVFEVVRDDAKYIRQDLGNLATNGLGTVVVVMIALFFFIGFRESLLASLAIPLSFLITFIILSAIGSSINFLSLFSLILALGILIDSAIVIVEGIHKYRGEGENAKDAAIKTIREFRFPLISGTLTTVFAFLPMLLMSGILGEFVKHIPITVTAVLMSSLFVALALTPTLASMWLGKSKKSKTKNTNGKFTTFTKWITIGPAFFAEFIGRYEGSMRRLLSNRKQQRRVSIGLIAALMLSFALPASGVLEVNMFPPEDIEFIFVDVKEPVGTPLEQTAKTMEVIEQELRKDDQIKSFALNVGSHSPTDDFGGSSSGTNVGHFVINLVDKSERQNSLDIVDYYARALPQLVEAEVTASQLGGGPPTGAPIEIVISGQELQVIEGIGQEFETFLKQTPGTRNVQTSIGEANPEFVISIDRAKAQLYGVSASEVAGILRNAVSGSKATTIRQGGEETEVMVKYELRKDASSANKTTVTDINEIESLTLATPFGNVPLSAFTNTTLSGGRPLIQHIDGERIVRVTSEVQKGANAQTIFAAATEKQQQLDIPQDYTVRMGGEREDIAQSYNDMFRAMILAVFLIASTLILQFNSYRQQFFIIALIPLSLIGVFVGLTIMGLPLSFPGIIGIVALAGIVVNDAIVLIDRINNNRRAGMEKKEAVVDAGKSRFQPIFLTTITTVVGILPITLSNPLWGSLGFAIIFGLSFSTILTLFVVPMLYLRYGEAVLE